MTGRQEHRAEVLRRLRRRAEALARQAMEHARSGAILASARFGRLDRALTDYCAAAREAAGVDAVSMCLCGRLAAGLRAAAAAQAQRAAEAERLLNRHRGEFVDAMRMRKAMDHIRTGLAGRRAAKLRHRDADEHDRLHAVHAAYRAANDLQAVWDDQWQST